MMDFLDPETAFALASVRTAARLTARIRAGMPPAHLTKTDMSPVTVADFAVQAYVARGLAETFPDDALVGEEGSAVLESDSGATMRSLVAAFLKEEAADTTEERVCAWIDRGAGQATGRFWTLDPVDGTKGYLRGGQYAIALALIEDGVVQLGALGCPGLDTQCRPAQESGAVLVARRGHGAWISPLSAGSNDFTPLRVSDCADPRQARILRSYESSHTNEGQIDAIAAHLGAAAPPVLMDSQAKYAVLAAGGGEIMLRLLSPKQPDYRERIWDQAAGSIVVEEAGGRVTDLCGEAFDFRAGRLLEHNTGVFVSNGHLHEAGLRAIAAVCGSGNCLI
ncbi:MAG: 3'(2'),5'-bisphosphate nucleotidase [Candidatus Hydrogenedentes bacterium]|nr:3'(2'),5'-bisphosphate nucleotidase [Candidatus Hydrogenedentota bacterium]